jgi:uncharacterized protein
MQSARPSRPVQRQAHARHAIELCDGSLRLVVVADTHGRPHRDSSRHIVEQEPNCILHAGDIGDPNVLRALEALAPLFAIRGNIDERLDTPDALTLDVRDGARLLVRLLMVHIGVAGPKLRREVAALARAEGASLVVCGHSHVPFIGRDKGLSVFNPGSIGPRRFQLPIVFGVIDIDRERVRMRHIDCETGGVWEP